MNLDDLGIEGVLIGDYRALERRENRRRVTEKEKHTRRKGSNKVTLEERVFKYSRCSRNYHSHVGLKVMYRKQTFLNKVFEELLVERQLRKGSINSSTTNLGHRIKTFYVKKGL